MTETTGRLGLADVLQHLGAELRSAQQRGGGTIAWMTAEVEMEVVVETSGAGGAKFWVVNGEVGRFVGTTTRLKVSLHPHSDDGQPDGVGM